MHVQREQDVHGGQEAVLLVVDLSVRGKGQEPHCPGASAEPLAPSVSVSSVSHSIALWWDAVHPLCAVYVALRKVRAAAFMSSSSASWQYIV